MKSFSNLEIAKLLREVSAAYSVKNGPVFKVLAYQKAADSVEKATSELKDLWEDKKLDNIPGLGKSIQAYLDELFRTGKVSHFESVKNDLPEAMFELLDVTGMGPKTAYKLTSTLKIKSVKDLENAAKSGKIRSLPGFGEKSEAEILSALGEFKNKSSRVVLPYAFSVAERLILYLKTEKTVERVEPLGSLRRMVATVGDVDIAVASKSPQNVISHFKKFREIERVLSAGPVSASAVLTNGMQADLKIQPPEAFGSLLQHFTGSKNHNIKLRTYSLKKGMSLSEQGIKIKGKIKKFKTEKEFYEKLGLAYVEPELREDSGEVEAAIKTYGRKSNGLPKLITADDIKGDLHLHSSYPIEPSHDLGNNTFQEILDIARKLGYQYIGLSDHSPGISNHTSAQIIELIKKRTHAIEQLKSSNKSMRILNLLEIDILSNGELSVPEAGLKILDGAIAGIHSSHRQEIKSITKRLLVAVNNPHVKIISHPTGRLLGQRESYDADWKLIFKECQKTKTILEINAWPTRLDLPDMLVKQAKEYGIKFAINSDAHDISHMDNMKFGVSVARRGWAEKKDIVNTLDWVEFKKYFDIS